MHLYSSMQPQCRSQSGGAQTAAGTLSVCSEMCWARSRNESHHITGQLWCDFRELIGKQMIGRYGWYAVFSDPCLQPCRTCDYPVGGEAHIDVGRQSCEKHANETQQAARNCYSATGEASQQRCGDRTYLCRKIIRDPWWCHDINAFHITDPLLGNPPTTAGIPLHRTNNVEGLCCSLWCYPVKLSQTI